MNTRPNDGTCDVSKGECTISGLIVQFDDLQAAATEAQKLAAGLNLVSQREREWYGDRYTEAAVEWFGVALLIQRIRNE